MKNQRDIINDIEHFNEQNKNLLDILFQLEFTDNTKLQRPQYRTTLFEAIDDRNAKISKLLCDAWDAHIVLEKQLQGGK